MSEQPYTPAKRRSPCPSGERCDWREVARSVSEYSGSIHVGEECQTCGLICFSTRRPTDERGQP